MELYSLLYKRHGDCPCLTEGTLNEDSEMATVDQSSTSCSLARGLYSLLQCGDSLCCRTHLTFKSLQCFPILKYLTKKKNNSTVLYVELAS